LPNVRDRQDSEAVAMQQSMNPDLVLAALDERSEPDGRMEATEEAAEDASG